MKSLKPKYQTGRLLKSTLRNIDSYLFDRSSIPVKTAKQLAEEELEVAHKLKLRKQAKKEGREMWKENSPETRKILSDFKSRLDTEEGGRRIKQLKLTLEDVDRLKGLKIRHSIDNPLSYDRNANRIRLTPSVEKRLLNPITRHEIEHAVQTRLPGKQGYSLIDEDLRKLKLKEDKFNWDINDIDNPFDFSTPVYNKPQRGLSPRVIKEFTDVDKSKKYFIKGSGGEEKAPMLAELQQWSLDQGIIKHPYEIVSPKRMEDIYSIYKKLPEKEQTLRIFNIAEPSKDNFKLLSNNFNKLLGLGVLTGAGAAQFKKGGKNKPQLQTGGSTDKSRFERLEDYTVDNILSDRSDKRLKDLETEISQEDQNRKELLRKNFMKDKNQYSSNSSSEKEGTNESIISSLLQRSPYKEKFVLTPEGVKDKSTNALVLTRGELEIFNPKEMLDFLLKKGGGLQYKKGGRILKLKSGGKSVKDSMKCGEVRKSTRKGKKIMKVYCVDGKKKLVHAGAKGYSDYTKHKDKNRRKNFHSRHNCDTAKPGTPRHLACTELW